MVLNIRLITAKVLRLLHNITILLKEKWCASPNVYIGKLLHLDVGVYA